MSALILCRTCGKHIYSLNSMKLFEVENNEILRKIHALTGIWFLDEPDMPDLICACCLLDLNNAIIFRERCLKIHNELLLKYSNLAKTVSTCTIKNVEEIDPLISCEEYCILPEIEYENDNIEANDSPASTAENMSENEEKSSIGPKKRLSAVRVPTNAQMKQIKTSNMTKKKNFYCDQCGKHFHCLSNLRVHLRRHTGIRSYECKECGHKDYTSYLLNVHIRIQHKGEKPFTCKYCGDAFSSSQTRATHQRSHEDSATKAKRLKFSCSHCNRSFTQKDTLKKHEVVHTGERPFNCDTCHVTFNRKSNLKTHYRSKQHIEKFDHISGNAADDKASAADNDDYK